MTGESVYISKDGSSYICIVVSVLLIKKINGSIRGIHLVKNMRVGYKYKLTLININYTYEVI